MADFNQLLKVLNREAPDRPVLFELFMNDTVYTAATGRPVDRSSALASLLSIAYAFVALGYDYATAWGPMSFPSRGQSYLKTLSLNEGFMITDRASFDSYDWPEPDSYDYSCFEQADNQLPKGMKLMIMGPGGVLENVIGLMGYDNLCLSIYDDEQLVYDVFEQVGKCFAGYYRNMVRFNSIGLVSSNDDWGFNTQTMLSVQDMRRFVFPWHRQIVEIAHSAGKPVILHSCGNFSEITEDLSALGFDARHSYEDNIIPVEKAYDMLSDKMAVLGGMDVDFLTRESERTIKERVEAMLTKTNGRAYAVGSGNSIPEYIPLSKYYAMINAAKNFTF